MPRKKIQSYTEGLRREAVPSINVGNRKVSLIW